MTTEPPPPYTEDASAPAPTTVSAYLLSRPFRGTTPPDTIEHKLDLVTADAKLSFPEPEKAWRSHDVTEHDWENFVTQIGIIPHQIESGQVKTAYRTRAEAVIDEWNSQFFNPRGIKVQPVFEGTGETKGFGFKVGNSFVGVSLGQNAHGYGIKLPGVLLGVSSPSEEKKDDK